MFLGVLGNYNTGFCMANYSFLTVDAEFKQTELSRILSSLSDGNFQRYLYINFILTDVG